jgi:S1-C subfamily serine protease
VAGRIRLIALVVLLGGGIHLLATAAQESSGRVPATQIIRSVVRAFVVNCELASAPDGDPMGVPIAETCQAIGSGSGTIIRQDGLILTNAHVALNATTGSPNWLLIGLTTDPRELPTAGFFARAVIYDAAVDLAVVEPAYALDGRPVEEGDVNLLPLPMAQNERSVQLEQPLRLIGYPGVGGSTVTIDPAVVSGFGFDDNVPELAGSAWIKTDPAGGSGISGGSTVDDDGVLVGVPTAGGLAEIRCLDLDGDGDTEPATECAATAGESGFSRPIPEAFSLLLLKAEQNGQIDGSGGTATKGDGVVITGRIVSADTGDPVPGAYVLVFHPGVTVEQAIDEQDPANTYAWDQTDNRGDYILNNPIVRNQGYGVLVYADGYAPISGDDIVLATDADPATKDVGVWELPSAQ